MITCKNCGVLLEDSVLKCPLCGTPVDETKVVPKPDEKPELTFSFGQRLSQKHRKLVWEIISIILLSGTITTFGIDMILNKSITWSIYPIAFSVVIFSYISLFAFWDRGIYIQLAGSLVMACLTLLVLDLATGHKGWSFKLAIPLLIITTIIVAVQVVIIRSSRYKGTNLISYAFLGIALLCLGIEGIISYYKSQTVELKWSVIASGCIIPVVIVLLFIHFRLKKGRNLERTFHI